MEHTMNRVQHGLISFYTYPCLLQLYNLTDRDVMIWLLALLNHRNMCQERMQLARRKVTEKLCELTEPGAQIFKNHEPFRISWVILATSRADALRKGEKSQLKEELVDLDRKEVQM